MTTATLTSKGQVTIPTAVRNSLGLESGSRIDFVEMENGQYLIVAATNPVQALKGLLRNDRAGYQCCGALYRAG